ncbi:MAG: nitronate monooxygenase [Rhodospirillaceae bacterium]
MPETRPERLIDLDRLISELTLPVVAAPMFIVSVPDLVVAECAAGVIGAFPALNAREPDTLDGWLTEIEGRTAAARAAGRFVAPHGVNLIVHRNNARLDADLATVIDHRVPIVITSVGAPGDIADAVHGYGGAVFHDVTNVRHAKKALESKVDGLILVCAGAGGHAGLLNPFALVPEVRSFFDGPVLLSGCISDGRSVHAARALGADLAYLGTRFIATEEANADDDYKRMILASAAADITYTPEFSGIPGSYLTKSIESVGLDPADLALPGQKLERDYHGSKEKPKAWATIRSAGQGVGSVNDVLPTAELVARLKAEYDTARADAR